MHFGIFLEERRPGSSDIEALRETLDFAQIAESCGIVDGVWLGEIHFNPQRSAQSAPMALASFVAARTRRVRIGTAVQVLPLGNPLRIAEEVATVDQLSEGRFDFGVGRSGVVRTYEILGIPYTESQARFEEALAVIRLAWTGQTFSYAGRFHTVENATVSPRPYQRPHPPIRMAANSADTFPTVGRLGLPIFIGCRDLGVPDLRKHVAIYREAWRDAGHPGAGDVCLRLPIYAAPTERAAVDEPREYIMTFFKRQFDLTIARLKKLDTMPDAERQARIDRLASLSYDDLLTTRVAFGTAAQLKDRLAELREELTLDGVIADMNPGGHFPLDRMQRTLRTLTEEVMPALK